MCAIPKTDMHEFLSSASNIILTMFFRVTISFIIIIIISNLSNDRPKASSKTIPPHSAI